MDKVYKVRPEYLDAWEGGNSPSCMPLIVTLDEIRSLAGEWEKPVEALMEQVDPIDPLRTVFLDVWHEYALFNAIDIDDGRVVAQGQQSGKYYVLTLDEDLRAVRADLY